MGQLLKELLAAADVQRFVVSTSDDAYAAADAWAKAIEFVLRDRKAAFVRAAELNRKLVNGLSWDSAVLAFTQAIENASELHR